jgi:hypothetical protein
MFAMESMTAWISATSLIARVSSKKKKLLFSWIFLLYNSYLLLLASYCSPDQFKCRNGTCISGYKRCDGRLDCVDFSDEMQCPRLNCDRTQFKCNNGSCIPQAWRWLANALNQFIFSFYQEKIF